MRNLMVYLHTLDLKVLGLLTSWIDYIKDQYECSIQSENVYG